jgi:hypothetical protein
MCWFCSTARSAGCRYPRAPHACTPHILICSRRSSRSIFSSASSSKILWAPRGKRSCAQSCAGSAILSHWRAIAASHCRSSEETIAKALTGSWRAELLFVIQQAMVRSRQLLAPCFPIACFDRACSDRIIRPYQYSKQIRRTTDGEHQIGNNSHISRCKRESIPAAGEHHHMPHSRPQRWDGLSVAAAQLGVGKKLSDHASFSGRE